MFHHVATGRKISFRFVDKSTPNRRRHLNATGIPRYAPPCLAATCLLTVVAPEQVPACIDKSALRTLLFQMDRRLIKAYLRDHKTQAVVPPDIRNGQAFSFSSASSGGPEPGAAEQSHAAGIQAQVYQGFADRGIFDGWRGTSGAGGEGGAAAAATTGDVEAFMSPTTMDDEADPTTLGGETWECTLEARRVFAHLKEVGST